MFWTHLLLRLASDRYVSSQTLSKYSLQDTNPTLLVLCFCSSALAAAAVRAAQSEHWEESAPSAANLSGHGGGAHWLPIFILAFTHAPSGQAKQWFWQVNFRDRLHLSSELWCQAVTPPPVGPACCCQTCCFTITYRQINYVWKYKNVVFSCKIMIVSIVTNSWTTDC